MGATVWTPANVSHDRIQEFLDEVESGLHHSSLDELLTGSLEGLVKLGDLRSWAKGRMAFVESIIEDQARAVLGLDAAGVRNLSSEDLALKHTTYLNDMMMDTTIYVTFKKAHMTSYEGFKEAVRTQNNDRVENATQAAQVFLYG